MQISFSNDMNFPMELRLSLICALYMQLSLFPWKVYSHEKSSAYYTSLMVEDVVREDGEDVREEGAASIHQSKTATRFIGFRNSDEPASKKRLFHGGDVETPKVMICQKKLLLS